MKGRGKRKQKQEKIERGKQKENVQKRESGYFCSK